MSDPIPHNALVVVADGGKALLFRNTGNGGEVVLHEERRLTHKDFANDGPSGSRPEDQTPGQTEEATFVKKLAETLFKMHERHAFKELVIVADPQTLGQMRDCMHKTVERSVVRSVSKDLTNHSAKDIAASLNKA